MAFNLTSKTMYPLALPYQVPNTVCGKYGYGGRCSDCLDPAVYGYTDVWPMGNNSLFMRRVGNDPAFGVEQVGLVRVDSSFILPEDRCEAGCTVRGGVCIKGQCHCQPGCSGADCSAGPTEVCHDKAPPKPISSDDDDV